MPTPATKSRSQWVSQFDTWAQGPSETETQKCENAERMVREAIASHASLNRLTIKVFAQGSYRNRTNVRLESDVDVCVVLTDAFYPDYGLAPQLQAKSQSNPSSYNLPWFKNEVQLALKGKFGESGIRREKKVIEVIENTYRVHADVVPAIMVKLFNENGSFREGTAILDDKTGVLTHNYPEYHIRAGEDKHTRTSRRYKKRVRILKNLCIDMRDADVASAEKMPSFLLESLVFNCPDTLFDDVDHFNGMKAIISHLWNLTKTDETAKNMIEANDVKFLFRKQKWTCADVHQFLLDAWQYVGW